ncbi:MAG: AAA family ATPase [Acidobacteria bacterium]|nr:AAA family ATPase [Acidobacteriota bacterium]
MVAVVAADAEQRDQLKLQVEATGIAQPVFAGSSYPAAPQDAVLRQISESNPEVVLVDIAPEETMAGLRALELIHGQMRQVAVFAIGKMDKPQVIVAAMRVGAKEFLERPTSVAQLLESLARYASAQGMRQDSGTRGKVITVVGAKGGSGATTVAVNLAMALHGVHGHVALVDLAPIGNAALHFRSKPHFTLVDALQNLHRLDLALLEGFMTQCDGGLRLLAGSPRPIEPPSAEQLARLLDLMVKHYRYIVVDASSRLDAATRAVCNFSETVLLVSQVDAPSIWTGGQVQQYLGESCGQEKIRLVLNRYRKVAGLGDHEIEASAHCKILWRVPNHYQAIHASIESGMPVLHVDTNSDLAKSFHTLAAQLTGRRLGNGSSPAAAPRKNLLERLGFVSATTS